MNSTIIEKRQGSTSSSNESLSITMNMIKGALSNICFLRGIFDDQIFSPRTWVGTHLWMLPSTKVNNILYKYTKLTYIHISYNYP